MPISLCICKGLSKMTNKVPSSPIGNTTHGDSYDIGNMTNVQGIAIGAGARAEINHYTEIIVKSDSFEKLEDLPPTPGEPPYKGLAYFTEKDADIYYGRETLSQQITTRLNQLHFLALIGASGSGKSSLLRAGLIPQLRAQNWLIHVITPGSHPLEALSNSIGRYVNALDFAPKFNQTMRKNKQALYLMGSKFASQKEAPRLLIAIDQFEEVFTQCRDEVERRAFVENLLTAANKKGAVTIMIGLRADFYDRCAQFEGLRELVSQQQEFIGPMKQEELVHVIADPAKRGGWHLVDGLMEQILEDAGQEPGRLPLLSHALRETWERRRGTVMTLSGYRAAGGVEGAIAKTAEETLQRLEQQDKRLVKVAQSVFLSLTELGEGAEDTRRIAPLQELQKGNDDQALDDVLNMLVNGRLITTSDGQVEVAHEALIRRWPRLRRWLADNREHIRFERQLAQDAQEWDDLNRDPGALYRGAKLQQAIEWSEKDEIQLTGLSARFLGASHQEAERATREKEAQRQRELTQQRELATEQQKRAEEAEAATTKQRKLTRIAFAIGGAALLLAILAIGLGISARNSTTRANARWLVSEGQKEVTRNPLLGISLVLEGVELANANLQDEIFLDELLDENVKETIFYPGRNYFLGDSIEELIYIPNEQMIFVGEGPRNILWSVKENGISNPVRAGNVRGTLIAGGKFLRLEYLDDIGEPVSTEIIDAKTGHFPEFVSGTLKNFQIDVDEIYIQFQTDAANGIKIYNVVSDQIIDSIHNEKFYSNFYEVEGGRFIIASFFDDVQIERWDIYDAQSGNYIQEKDYFDYIHEEVVEREFYDLEDMKLIGVSYQDNNTKELNTRIYDAKTKLPLDFVPRTIDLPYMIDHHKESGLLTISSYDLDGNDVNLIFDMETGFTPTFLTSISNSSRASWVWSPFLIVKNREYYSESEEPYKASIYNLQTKERLDFIEENVEEINFANDQYILVKYSDDSQGETILYEIITGESIIPSEYTYESHNPDSLLFVFSAINHLDSVRDKIIIDIGLGKQPEYIIDDQPILDVDISLDGEAVVITYENKRLVYDHLNRKLLMQLDSDRDISDLRLYRESNLLHINYASGMFMHKDVVYSLKSGTPLVESNSASGNVYIDSSGRYAVTQDMTNDNFKLWKLGEEIAYLGSNVKKTVFITPTQQLAVWYGDGSAYLLDLEWLDEMAKVKTSLADKGKIDLPVSIIIDATCKYVMQDFSEELKQILQEGYLDKIGEKSKVCMKR